METKAFLLFEKNGVMQELEPVKSLPIGMRIYGFGYAMSESVYCVAEERNGRGVQKIVLASEYYREDDAPISFIDKYCRPVSEKFGIGNYWGFFRVRGYKKGTMHFEFEDEKTWELFNRRVSEIKGWRLPGTSNSTKKARKRGGKLEIY